MHTASITRRTASGGFFIALISSLAFLLEVEAVPPGLDPGWYTNVLSLGTNRDHLKLQGVSTVDFNVQNKPYPEHWGKPPNVNFKGHDGVVRDLPGGYGRGNRALAARVGASAPRETRYRPGLRRWNAPWEGVTAGGMRT